MVSETVATIRPGVLDDEARRAYAAAFNERTDTSGGLVDMDACLAGALLFEVIVGGRVVGRYALAQVDRQKGRAEVYIVAAVGSLNGVSLVDQMLGYVEQQCEKADCVTVHTRRRGLVKKLAERGYTLDGYIMRKKRT